MPRHKKKRRAANAAAGSVKKTDWTVGDLVVVKLRGHRPWPAQIQKPEDYGYDARPHRIFVTFFGTEETCFCSYNKITPFTSAVRKSLAEQLQKISTNSELERAIKEIFAADDELKKSRDKSRHKEDEIGSEKSEGGEVPPVERSRKRGRTVEEDPTDVAEERSAKHEKTVKKMAPEQVHKLLPKVRIKVSSQPSDSSHNQQAGSGTVPTSAKANVSSSEAPSREISPRRTSDLNEKGEDAPGRKTVRATRVHDAAELADAPDKKTGRAASDQKSEKEDTAVKHGVQNGDGAAEQRGMDEGSQEKETSTGQEDVEKMEVDDDQKVEDAMVVDKISGTGRDSDSIDHHGVEGLDKEEMTKENLRVAEQKQSEHADTPLPSLVKEGESKSATSTGFGDRDVVGDRAGGKVDLKDHPSAAKSVLKNENESSGVSGKAQVDSADVKQGSGRDVAASVSPKQEDDSKEAQDIEPSAEEHSKVDASTATVKDLPSSNREADSKDSASGQPGDTSSTLTKEDKDVVTTGSEHQTSMLEDARKCLGTTHSSSDDVTKTPVADGDTEMIEAKETDSVKSQGTDVTKGEGDNVEKDRSTDGIKEGNHAVKTQSTSIGEEDRGAVKDSVNTQSPAMIQQPGGEGVDEGTAKLGSTAQAVVEDSVKVPSTGKVSEKLQTKVDSVTTEPMAEAGGVKDATDENLSTKKARTESGEVAVSSEKAATRENEKASPDKEGVQKSPVKVATVEEEVSVSPIKDTAPHDGGVLVAPAKRAGNNDDQVAVTPGKDSSSADEKAPVSMVKEASKVEEKE